MYLMALNLLNKDLLQPTMWSSVNIDLTTLTISPSKPTASYSSLATLFGMELEEGAIFTWTKTRLAKSMRRSHHGDQEDASG